MDRIRYYFSQLLKLNQNKNFQDHMIAKTHCAQDNKYPVRRDYVQRLKFALFDC